MYMYKLLHKRCRSRYASVQTFDVLFVFAWFDLNLFYCIKEYKKFRFKICQLYIYICSQISFLTAKPDDFQGRIVSDTKDFISYLYFK